MPVGVVKSPEDEKHWSKAKSLAAQQGHAKDWAYIMGIYQRMKGGGGDKAEKCMVKSEVTPWARVDALQPKFIISRWPGQVPSRAHLEEQRIAKEMAMPMPFHPAMLYNPGGTYLTPASVLDGLGFDRAQENEWREFLGKAIQTPNELVLRQSLLSKMLNEKLDAPRRRQLFGRALSYYRDMRKSMVNVVTVDELRKSAGEGSRGGQVIGHTGSGKPIYAAHGHDAHADFTPADHRDAYNAHTVARQRVFEQAANRYEQTAEYKRRRSMDHKDIVGEMTPSETEQAKHHLDQAATHLRDASHLHYKPRPATSAEAPSTPSTASPGLNYPRREGAPGNYQYIRKSHGPYEYAGIVDRGQQGDPDGRLERVLRILNNRVANGGPCGVSLDKLGDVVKAYGSKLVAKALTKACAKGGTMTFKKGLLQIRGL